MRTAIIVHGTPSREEYFDPAVASPSNCHWLPWLQKQFLLENIEAQTPELPAAYRPDYARWSHTFSQCPVDSSSVLVGHSCGGGFLVRWLSENTVSPRRVVVVAPWMDPDRNHCTQGFFDFTIDRNLPRRTDLHLIYSDNDSNEVDRSVETIRSRLSPLSVHLIEGGGHFVGISQFPILRRICLEGL